MANKRIKNTIGIPEIVNGKNYKFKIDIDAKIVNKTAHAIKIVDHITKKLITIFPPAEEPARIEYRYIKRYLLSNKEVPIMEKDLIAFYNIPEREENTYYIVSNVVASYFPERDDFLIPTTKIRDKYGIVIGIAGLEKNPFVYEQIIEKARHVPFRNKKFKIKRIK